MEDESSTASVTPKENTGWIESLIIATVQTSVGQKLFKLIDSFLWVIEKTAQWSLPSQEIAIEESGKIFGKLELVRPLPWLLFLPGLVILRMIRIGLNMGAYVLGYPEIQASGMVKFVQRTRRRLRAMNLRAMKSKRRVFPKDRTMIEAKKALIRSIRLTLSTLSCLDTSKSSHSPPPTKIRISHMDLEPGRRTSDSFDSPTHHDSKRKYSELSSDDESIDESTNAKLDRLADFGSTDDTTFNRKRTFSGLTFGRTCLVNFQPVDYTTSSTESSENGEEDVSLAELKKLRREARALIESREKIEDEKLNRPVYTIRNVLQGSSSKNVEKAKKNMEQEVDSSEPQETSYSVDEDSINGQINSTDETDKDSTLEGEWKIPTIVVKIVPKPKAGEVKTEVTPEVNSGMTPEVTPEITSEITPEITSKVTPEVILEETSEVESEVTPEVTPEATSKVTPEVTPEATSEVTPEVTPEATSEVESEVIPEVNSGMTPEVTPEVTSKVTPKVTSEVTPEVTSKITPEVTSEITPEVESEVTPKVTPEVTSEVTPEVTSEITPEVESEVTLKITPEVTSEVTPEVKSEVTPKVTSEVTPEVTSEVTPEVTSEVTPEVTLEVTPEVILEVTPEVMTEAVIEKQAPQSIPGTSSEACTSTETAARTRVNSANFPEKKNNKKKYGRYRDSK
ncbi:surface protein-like isoform X2 [Frieseomelitta varia]|uniref:surface protein-like isoform X2 n=1 Tax=Frieseomelitta varia TaxID=561572 RepID=UPI001CB6B260|nr:surface protein-like isoform X2 [Frieseomelitta varia]XP_043515395.1 surface protein-like isoform X2 [Frieseomelitta varia]